MSGRKPSIIRFQNITNQPMYSDITSEVSSIQFLDNVGLQFTWTGNPTGSFDVQVSIDYEQDGFGNVINPGNWIDIDLASNPTASGTADSIYIDLNQLSSPWIRVKYITSFEESGEITTVADVDGSLNDTYFFLTAYDGTEYYIWFNVEGGGTDPAIPGMTGIEVDISALDSADTVATALGAAMAAITQIGNIVVSTNTVTFDQDAAGHGALYDSDDAPTEFTFDYTQTTGVLNAYLTAKGI